MSLTTDHFAQEATMTPQKISDVNYHKLNINKIPDDVEIVNIYFSKNHSSIEAGRQSFRYHAGFKNSEYDRKMDLAPNRLYLKRIDAERQTELVEDPVNECLNLVKKLYAAFPNTPFIYTISLREFKNEEPFVSLIRRCLVGDYVKVSIFELDKNCIERTLAEMEFLMNFVNKNAYFDISCKIPEDFRHENAFKFPSVHYGSARWVTLDQLKPIRNCDEVRLGGTNFTNEDINQFLHYWINCEETMIKSRISMFVKNGVQIDAAVIMDGIDFQRDGYWRYIKSGKQKILGRLEIAKYHIDLRTFKTRDQLPEIHQLENGFDYIFFEDCGK
ncbi:unnamed protein product [Caenorhabditis brenneri]